MHPNATEPGVAREAHDATISESFRKMAWKWNGQRQETLDVGTLKQHEFTTGPLFCSAI